MGLTAGRPSGQVARQITLWLPKQPRASPGEGVCTEAPFLERAQRLTSTSPSAVSITASFCRPPRGSLKTKTPTALIRSMLPAP